MEPRAGGPRRDAEHPGRLIEREPDVVVQHQDRPLVDVEASEAALELIAVGEIESKPRVVPSLGFRRREGFDLDLEAPPPAAAACFAIARVDEQAMEPRLET